MTNPDALVHIIDDDEDLRNSLDSLFRSVGMTTRLYSNAKEFLQASLPDVASCLVVDVRLPGQSGLDFQDQLAASGCTIPIIFITGHGDIPMTVRAMKAGAVDFLAKPFRDQVMLEAVSTALGKDRETRNGGAELAALTERYQTLTTREKQVVTLVTTGLMNKQVAGKLNLSEVTVKIHRGTAMRKMQAKTLADLVKMAQQLKLHANPFIS